jgi:hypothetical protein
MASTQHAAVVAASQLILGSDFQAGVDIRSYITKAQKEAVVDEVTRMLVEGEAEISAAALAKYGDKLRSQYVVGMVSNWFMKSKTLNGGVKHEVKNPGSRAGAKDEKVSELRALRKNMEAVGAGEEVIAKIDAAIQERLGEIRKTTKAADFSSVNYAVFSEADRKGFAAQLEGLGVDVSGIEGLAEFASSCEDESEAA